MSDTPRSPDLEDALRKLQRLSKVMAAVRHQLTFGEASEGDLRDIAWCAQQLGDALDIVTPAPGCETARRFFVHDGEAYDASYTTPAEAMKAAEAALDRWRTDARDEDGWADEAALVAWGEVLGHAVEVPATDDDTGDAGCDYRLMPCAGRSGDEDDGEVEIAGTPAPVIG